MINLDSGVLQPFSGIPSQIPEPHAGEGVVVAEDAILLLVVPLVASSVFGELGSGLIVIVLIIVFFLFAGRAAFRATRQLEETFELS